MGYLVRELLTGKGCAPRVYEVPTGVQRQVVIPGPPRAECSYAFDEQARIVGIVALLTGSGALALPAGVCLGEYIIASCRGGERINSVLVSSEGSGLHLDEAAYVLLVDEMLSQLRPRCWINLPCRHRRGCALLQCRQCQTGSHLAGSDPVAPHSGRIIRSSPGERLELGVGLGIRDVAICGLVADAQTRPAQLLPASPLYARDNLSRAMLIRPGGVVFRRDEQRVLAGAQSTAHPDVIHRGPAGRLAGGGQRLLSLHDQSLRDHE